MRKNKIQIDITTVNQFKDYLAWVNSLDLDDIQLMDRGRIVRVMEGAVEKFKFTGLSNVDFIRSEFYRSHTRLEPDEMCPSDDMRCSPCSERCMGCDHNCGTVTDNDGYVTAIMCSFDKFNKLKE